MTEKRFTNVNEDIFQYGQWYCSAKSEHCADVITTALNEVLGENEQLKQRNDNQYKQLQSLWSLMEAKDWETLTEMVEQMHKDEERLRNEWKCYE